MLPPFPPRVVASAEATPSCPEQAWGPGLGVPEVLSESLGATSLRGERITPPASFLTGHALPAADTSFRRALLPRNWAMSG